MYLQNKYTRIYYMIIEHAQSRNISGYTEKHHIIPRSMGGTNKKDNLVALTGREHFICHLLLAKMTQGLDRSKMVLAVFKLMGKGKREHTNIIKSSRSYEKLKTELSAIVSKQHKGRKRPPRSIEYCEKMRQAKKGENAWNWLGNVTTPWGIYESAEMAANSCPEYITANYIRSICTKKNTIPISYLSVCRSKGWLSEEHIGKTPCELGFAINTI
jgi:hypothetical protein